MGGKISSRLFVHEDEASEKEGDDNHVRKKGLFPLLRRDFQNGPDDVYVGNNRQHQSDNQGYNYQNKVNQLL